MSNIQTPDDAEQVLLCHIALTSYRNYTSLQLDFSSSHVVLVGHNGVGKTNLLEAVSFLSPGRGLRRATYQDVTSSGQSLQRLSGFCIHVRLKCTIYGEVMIGTGGVRHSAKGRQIRINDTQQPADMMLEYCRILWLVPAMDRLLVGSPAERRRFLDRMVMAIDPLHGRRVLAYEKAMRARNHLLAESTWDTVWLDALETQMAELGTAIAAARQKMVRLLDAATENLLHRGCFPQAVLSLEGSLEKSMISLHDIDVAENFRRQLREYRSIDRNAKHTLEGPHRTDLGVLHKEKSIPAILCSTGEQKALLTGLILSHARLTGELSGMKPILLLDEIAAHLDVHRRQTLFNILDDLGAQTFMTGTEKALFSDLDGRAEFFFVQDNHIKSMG
ncbi:MAG: DNA replication and repair protein RecF [Candidatus Tokpelaia sp. JSC085]|nr:MAG: DNA replication and repair protein RecF [Candidatus Tokpelaia sp. JSC085]